MWTEAEFLSFSNEKKKQKIKKKRLVLLVTGIRPTTAMTRLRFQCIYCMEKKKFAMAGNRTRVDCLEGNHANLYTTIAANN